MTIKGREPTAVPGHGKTRCCHRKEELVEFTGGTLLLRSNKIVVALGSSPCEAYYDELCSKLLERVQGTETRFPFTVTSIYSPMIKNDNQVTRD